MVVRSFGILCASIFLIACSANNDCVDRDGDAFGPRCAQGPDCDDTNPLRTNNCDRVPSPDCVNDPFATGCPCVSGAAYACYSGNESTLDKGVCHGGEEICRNGHWGLCVGEHLPSTEACNALDDDCDGLIDNGVVSACGGCDARCEGLNWGADPNTPFTRDDPATDISSSGQLTLARTIPSLETIWVANTGDGFSNGTVSKIQGSPPSIVETFSNSGGQEPSRVAVDYQGDAWIVNSAVSSLGQGSVAKFIAADCSGDACIAFSKSVPTFVSGAVPRAIAIDGNRDGTGGGHAWIGLYERSSVIELDSLGNAIQEISNLGLRPFAATFDPWGTLWILSRDGQLISLLRTNPSLRTTHALPLRCFTTDSLASDPSGNIYVTGFDCASITDGCDGMLSVYNPQNDSWSTTCTDPQPRGVVFWDGSIWITHNAGSLSRVALSTLAVAETFQLATQGFMPAQSTGISADSRNGIWVVSTNSVRTQPNQNTGLATRWDINTKTTSQLTVGMLPQVQGDFTGASLRGRFLSPGAARHVFPPCPSGESQWKRLHIRAETHAVGTITLEVRTASDEASLTDAPPAFIKMLPNDVPPFDLNAPSDAYVEVRLILQTPAWDSAPSVDFVGVERQCGATPI